MSKYSKKHIFNPDTALTYCGYRKWEVLIATGDDQVTCIWCLDRKRKGNPAKQANKMELR